MEIHYLQHVPFEGIASIEHWAKSKGHSLSATRLYQNEPLPKVEDIDWLLIMGGPMNIYEEIKYSWLAQEKRFIEQAVKHEKVILGICLGAQLIADVLGAKVFSNKYKEIGWFPIELTSAAQTSPIFNFLPKRLSVFHWHGDTFELPSGAIQIAKSDGCQNQAFIYNESIIGLQFHLESTKNSVQALLENCADEIVEGKYIQKSDQLLSHEDSFKKINDAMHGILDRLSSKTFA
ncbi:MAG: type 1 glutamine amidotransferase [Iphinoe sp. HA4291-MV1]|jgi:GMP synthase (glutamine-hydrolysing)|nr:type 1 glutamine amidotransferase [Iphinoe sp. HA4291-MV1]